MKAVHLDGTKSAPHRPWHAAIRRIVAPLLIFLAGACALANLMSPQGVAITALLALMCYAPDIQRRETLSWLLIGASVMACAMLEGIDMLISCANAGATYGALMIAISFVQPSARRAVIAEAIAARIERIASISRSWKAHTFAHAAGATLNLSGLIILQAAAQRTSLSVSARLTATVVFLRGFATAPVWSPYSYFTPLILASFPSLSWPILLTVGMIITGVFILLSINTPPSVGQTSKQEQLTITTETEETTAPHTSIRWLIFAVFFGCVIGLLTISKLESMTAIVLALPPLAIAWGLLESCATTTSIAFARSVGTHVVNQIPALRTEILALAAAGMASKTIAHWNLSTPTMWSIVDIGLLGEVVQSVVIFFLILIATRVGINPVLFIAPIAASLAAPAYALLSLPAAVMVLCCAWALFPTLSPFAAATLITSREGGTTARDLVRHVNARYNRNAIACCALMIMVTVAANRIFVSF